MGDSLDDDFPRHAPWDSRLWARLFYELELSPDERDRLESGPVSGEWAHGLRARFFESQLTNTLGTFVDPCPAVSRADFTALFGEPVSLCATSGSCSHEIHKGHAQVANALGAFLDSTPVRRASTRFKPKTETVLLLGQPAHSADERLRTAMEKLEMEFWFCNELDRRRRHVTVSSMFNCSPLRIVESERRGVAYCPVTSIHQSSEDDTPSLCVDIDYLLVTHFDEERSKELFGVPSVWACQGCYVTATRAAVELLGTPRWRSQLLALFRPATGEKCRSGQAVFSVRRCADGHDAWAIDKLEYTNLLA